MDIDQFRLALGLPFLTGVFESTYQLFFLGIHRHDRPSLGDEPTGLVVEISKLGISVRVSAAFQRLRISLQTIASLVEQLADEILADVMTLLIQRFR